ncbi:hypothetical protein [Streptosporangium roseum]|uniref:hypothetical protein n=1 Tax=Streptosporangium roseum TaxID=2001 RepID=UPI00068C9242|nr:hypothetical protein [Streptosporangium roseum]
MSDPNLLAGRYRLLERRDRTGTAWRARDELLNRDVTIAEVRLPPPGPHRDWLLGQIRAAADLRHPGVATLHDVISAPDRMWLVLESVEGRSLIQTVRSDGPLSSEHAAEIGLRVLDTLTAAHAWGFHLAATPETVLLTPDGRVVLTGVADPVPAGDLRDLGATLFTAIEGRAPDTGSQAVPRMADGTPLAAPAAGPTGSGPLAPLVEGLLAADPAHRPDATSVRLSLERVAPHSAAPHSAASRSRRGPLVIAAAATAVAAVAAGAFWLWPRPADLTPPDLEPAPLAEPTSFTAIPRPCGLLSKDQLAKLYLADRTFLESATGCGRGTADSSQPANLRYLISYKIRIFPPRSDGTERKKAHSAFVANLEAAERNAGTDADGAVRTPPAPIRGIGQEAYTGTLDTSSEHAVGIVFRLSNLLVTIEYQRGAGRNSSGQTEKGAADAAKWIAEALVRKG